MLNSTITRAIAADVGMGKSFTKLKKPLQSSPYPRIYEVDKERRLQFWEGILHLIETQPDYLYRTPFSDETIFFSNGSWRNVNPYWIWESHTQHSQEFNIWIIIMVNKIIGLFNKWNAYWNLIVGTFRWITCNCSHCWRR